MAEYTWISKLECIFLSTKRVPVKKESHYSLEKSMAVVREQTPFDLCRFSWTGYQGSRMLDFFLGLLNFFGTATVSQWVGILYGHRVKGLAYRPNSGKQE